MWLQPAVAIRTSVSCLSFCSRLSSGSCWVKQQICTFPQCCSGVCGGSWCGGRLGSSLHSPLSAHRGVLAPLLALSALLCAQQLSLRRQLTPQDCLSTLRWRLRGSGRGLDLPRVCQCGFVELLSGEGGSSLDPDHAATPGDAPEGEPSSEAPVSLCALLLPTGDPHPLVHC